LHPENAILCEVIHIHAQRWSSPSDFVQGRRGIQMRKITFVIAAAALILTASVGGWVASTTAHDRGADFQNFRGGTPAGGGLFIMPPVY
jgi:hypothetical protein